MSLRLVLVYRQVGQLPNAREVAINYDDRAMCERHQRAIETARGRGRGTCALFDRSEHMMDVNLFGLLSARIEGGEPLATTDGKTSAAGG